MRYILLGLLAVATAQAQLSVGDYALDYKATSTGAFVERKLTGGNSKIWCTDSSGLPVSITVGSGILLAADTNTLTVPAPDLSPYLTSADAATIYATLTGVAAAYQPKDADLTNIAALSTAPFGRSLLTAVDDSAAQALMGIGSAGLRDTGTTEGTVPLIGENGLLTVQYLNAAPDFDPTQVASLNFGQLAFRNVQGSGNQQSLVPLPATDTRFHYLPDRSGTLLHADGDGSALTGLTKGQVGLGNVANALQLVAANNLSDLSNAATARSNLGLGSVNNTSDAAKPVSTATQTALDALQLMSVRAMEFDVDAWWFSGTTGSGNTSALSYLGVVRTGTTAGSTAFRGGPQGTAVAWNCYNDASNDIDWGKRFAVSTWINITANSANGQAWWQFGRFAGGASDLSQRGIGIRVNNLSCAAQAYESGSLTVSSTLATLTAGARHHVTLVNNADGTAEVRIDGVSVGTITGVPTGRDSATFWGYSVRNNSDSANTEMYFGHFKFTPLE